jgi:dUTP pyrophosphatase
MLGKKVIKIKYLRDISPIKALPNGDWIDLRAAKDVMLEAGQVEKIPLGFACELPKGYEAYILPRSSTGIRYHIIQLNSKGVVDNSYKGDNDEWMVPVIATDKTFIEKDTRICQFRIAKKQPEIIFKIVESLGNPDRNGFGSTGIK